MTQEGRGRKVKEEVVDEVVEVEADEMVEEKVKEDVEEKVTEGGGSGRGLFRVAGPFGIRRVYNPRVHACGGHVNPVQTTIRHTLT